MAGHEWARYNLGIIEYNAGNTERGLKHYKIAASAGNYQAMHTLIELFKTGVGSRDVISSTLEVYNKSTISCVYRFLS